MKNVDYSDKAISMRIRQASQLRKLCLSLGKATRAEPKITPSTSRAGTDPRSDGTRRGSD
jgi:hypothetical protein